MMFILMIVIVVLLFLLMRRNNSPRGSYDYSRPEPPYQTGYGGGPIGGMGGRGIGMFAGGLAAGALLSYLWEQGRLSEDQYHYYNSLGDQEAIYQLQEQNLIQQHEIDDLRSRIAADEAGYQDNDPYQDDYNSGNDTGGYFDDGGNNDDFI